MDKATPASINILCLDPSTDVTGAAVIRYPLDNGGRGDGAQVLRYTAIDAGKAPHIPKSKTDLATRVERYRWTQTELSRFLDSCPYSIHYVAYEMDTGRGHYSSEALIMAAGHYLALPQLKGLEKKGITRMSACVAAGCFKEYRAPKGKTNKEQKEKIANLKRAIVQWAIRTFDDLCFDPFDESGADEAVCDALAVGMAAGCWYSNQQQAEARKAAQKPLFGKGSGTSRKAAPKATGAAK